MSGIPVQNDLLFRAFDRFVADHLETPEGRGDLALYERSVREGRSHYRATLAALDRGDDITDLVLLQLLPYMNTRANVKRGSWIHVTPGIQSNIRSEFERRGWVRRRDWPRVAREIFRFLHAALDDPAHLSTHTETFCQLDFVKGIQSGILSPLLEAIQPKRYAVVNPRVVKGMKWLTGESFSTSLDRYPRANTVLQELMREVGDELVERAGLRRIPAVRLFNLFCWWGGTVGLFDEGGRSVAERASAEGVKDVAPAPIESKRSVRSDQSRVAESVHEYQPDQNRTKRLSPDECATLLNIPLERLQEWMETLRAKRQIILYGPPGTGKTFIAEHLAAVMVDGGDGLNETIQFHPSYSYEDFVQGIRPRRLDDGGIDYPVVEGRFLRFCRDARMVGDDPSVLVIDEINRANLSEVFGELMYLLEYRERSVPLAVDGHLFSIPENVLLIGTMNTADRSIALVDHALRRRFAFIEIPPDFDLLRRYVETHPSSSTGLSVDSLIILLERINRAIDDRHYALGISYFLRPDLPTHLKRIWQREIEPYLEEFWFDDPVRVDEFRWNEIADQILLPEVKKEKRSRARKKK